MTIGTHIRRYRNEGGITQRKLADEVELTESAIRNYKRDIRTPSDQQIGRIAEALERSMRTTTRPGRPDSGARARNRAFRER